MPAVQVKCILALAFLIGFAGSASALTCSQVRWAVKNMSPDLLASYVAAATPAQIAFGRRCLRPPHHKARRRPRH